MLPSLVGWAVAGYRVGFPRPPKRTSVRFRDLLERQNETLVM